jgi:hypothetical protein
MIPGREMGKKNTDSLMLKVDESARNRVLDPRSIEASLKTNEPLIGGTIILLVSVAVLTVTIAFYPRRMEDISPPFFPTDNALSLVRSIFYICGFLSPFGIIGGLLAILRRHYAVAMLGAAASVVASALMFYVIGIFVTLVGMAMIATSIEQFKTRPQKRPGPPFPE